MERLGAVWPTTRPLDAVETCIVEARVVVVNVEEMKAVVAATRERERIIVRVYSSFA